MLAVLYFSITKSWKPTWLKGGFLSMEIQTCGKPSFQDLGKCEKILLLDSLVEVITAFYTVPKNRLAFEKWVADGKPMTNTRKPKPEQQRFEI